MTKKQTTFLLFFAVAAVEVLCSYLYFSTRLFYTFGLSIIFYCFLGFVFETRGIKWVTQLVILVPFFFVRASRLVMNSSTFFPVDTPILLLLSAAAFALGLYVGYPKRHNYAPLVIAAGVICTTLFCSEVIVPRLWYKTRIHSFPNPAQVDFKYNDWDLLTLEGKPLPYQLFTNKVILLNFTFSQCKPCIQKQSSLEWVNSKIDKSKIAIIEVDLGEYDSLTEAKIFSERTESNLQWAYDKDNILAKKLNFNGAPYQVLLDRNGNIVQAAAGFDLNIANLYENTTLKDLNELSRRK